VNAEERQVIDDIFRRLEQVADQPRDAEAERYIADKVRRQPYAPYALAQQAFVQEQAIANLSAELEQLRAEAEAQRRQPQQGGFLSGLFGGGRPAEPARGAVPPTGSPWNRPQQGYGEQPGFPQPAFPQQGGPMQGGPTQGSPWGGGMANRGGGFLSGALTTAAGVAGGMMVANALSHAFGGGQSGLSDKAASLSSPTGDQTAREAGTDANDPAGGYSDVSDGIFHDASSTEPEPDDGGFDDFGGDAGDGGDWV
jgi:uncharacterized protein